MYCTWRDDAGTPWGERRSSCPVGWTGWPLTGRQRGRRRCRRTGPYDQSTSRASSDGTSVHSNIQCNLRCKRISYRYIRDNCHDSHLCRNFVDPFLEIDPLIKTLLKNVFSNMTRFRFQQKHHKLIWYIIFCDIFAIIVQINMLIILHIIYEQINNLCIFLYLLGI